MTKMWMWLKMIIIQKKNKDNIEELLIGSAYSDNLNEESYIDW